MQPFAVVKVHDVIGDVIDGFLVVGVIALPHPLHFQVEEEGFHDAVVPTIALPAHASDQPVLAQQLAVSVAGVLTATVGMDDQAGFRAALADSQAQRRAHQFGSKVQPAATGGM